MAYNGSGTYNLYTPGNPVVTGTTISSTWANNTLNDLATALSTVICKDGQTTTSQLIPFAAGASVATGLFQYPASTTVGRWTTPTFAAGNFTASGAMTWTVASGNVKTYEYTIVDKVMTLLFGIEGTSVGGTPNTELRVAIPAGHTAVNKTSVAYAALDNSAVTVLSSAVINASGTYVILYCPTGGIGSNWTASASNTSVAGQITFEIT